MIKIEYIDDEWVATDSSRSGCSATGNNQYDALRELADAQESWDQATEKKGKYWKFLVDFTPI
jgi:hypothetical protein